MKVRRYRAIWKDKGGDVGGWVIGRYSVYMNEIGKK